MIFNQDTLERYFDRANERHRIYMQRHEGAPWPWTEDEIFRTYKFTQVYRTLDAGTLWLEYNWMIPYANHPLLFFNICLYRQFNYINTAEYLGFQTTWDTKRVYDDLSFYKNATDGAPRRIYTNAHMIAGPKFNKVGYREKLRWTIYGILDPLYNGLPQFSPQTGDSLQDAYKRLLPAIGFGPFITYEVISDLRWTRYLNHAPDIMTWANAGPGAIRGLNRLLGRDYKCSMHQDEAVDLMREILSLSPQYLADYMPAWDMRTVEHWACEFDKYERVRLGQGRLRVKFVPPHMRGSR